MGCEKNFKDLSGEHFFKDGVYIVQKHLKRTQAFRGTGSIYEGHTVLSDVSGDLFHDGRPSLLTGLGGETLVAWRKDSDPEEAIGSSVVVSRFGDMSWEDPVQIAPAGDFNWDPVVVFEREGKPFVFWAQAPASGITPESSAEEILEAASATEIFYSMRIDGAWTYPREVFSMAGSEYSICAASDNQGTIVVAWVHNDATGEHVFAKVFSGGEWSPAQALTMQGGCRSPTCAFSGSLPIVAWTQDTDGDLETSQDTAIFFSFWQEGDWSTPVSIPKEEAVRKKAGGVKSGSSCSVSLDLSPPPDCCKCPEEDPDCDEEPPDDPSPPEEPERDQTDEVDQGRSTLVLAFDPNEKRGSMGAGEEHFLEAGSEITYTVYFENRSNASAPAQEVFITDFLDEALNWDTFRVREIAYGDRIIAITEERDYFYTREKVGAWLLDIEVALEKETGEIVWAFRTLDPETERLPLDPMSGFLPPNCDSENPECDCSVDPSQLEPVCKDGRGEGHVSFSIRTKPDLVPGTRIENWASIVFDTNDPIVTNVVFNTIGELPPEAPAWPVPADGQVGVSTDVVLNWAGAERARAYDLYLWEAGQARPDVPTGADLPHSYFRPEEPFAFETTYNWQVVAKGLGGDTQGAVWTFTTGAPPPPLPGQPSEPFPPEGATRVPLRPTFTWADAENAQAYSLYLWKESETRPERPYVSGLRAPQFQLASDLLQGTVYAWQVVAWNVSGETAGPVWVFETERPLVPFRRGDVNADSSVDIADPIFVLSYLFAGGTLPVCDDAADANDDEALDIGDAIKILGHLFGQEGPLPEPFTSCGIDPEGDELLCGSFTPCER